MFSHQRKKVALLLAIADILLTAIAFEAAYNTRTHLPFHFTFFLTNQHRFVLLLFSVLFWLTIGITGKIYERLDSARPSIAIRITLRQCFLGMICVVLFEYLLRYDLSRGFLSLFFVYDFALLLLFRLNSRRIVGAFQREFGTPSHVILVGSPAATTALRQQLSDGSTFLIHIVGAVTEEECMATLPGLLRRQVIDEVIFRVNSEDLSRLEEIFLLCDEEGVRTRVAADFFPHVNSHMSLDRLGTAPLLTFSAAPDDDFRLFVKRLFDITVSLIAFIALWPLMILIALLIRLTSPGPAIFRQTRCGLNGRRFTFYKFRSMVQNAEALKEKFAHLNEKTTAFKIADDPRLTPVGRWLRKFSLDELPQFANVLRGDMSIVGPRPAVPGEVDHYHRWQRRRLRMRPGLTCLWAIRGRDRLDFETWMRMDMEYIDNWSLSLDWIIILKSIPYVLTGRGAN